MKSPLDWIYMVCMLMVIVIVVAVFGTLVGWVLFDDYRLGGRIGLLFGVVGAFVEWARIRVYG